MVHVAEIYTDPAAMTTGLMGRFKFQVLATFSDGFLLKLQL